MCYPEVLLYMKALKCSINKWKEKSYIVFIQEEPLLKKA
ncbi:hypothetical protein EV202_1125 [Bacteroides heparinolyticus]|uniref:Uncharacterized protein n=1 Tax=Prevotella heparinolytica TaxID=28113 RepID=A0A4R2LM15_9BACE|nr:hypothetical protein EV202_1125 [Bacteroides heparinolyticus]